MIFDMYPKLSFNLKGKTVSSVALLMAALTGSYVMISSGLGYTKSFDDSISKFF